MGDLKRQSCADGDPARPDTEAEPSAAKILSPVQMADALRREVAKSRHLERSLIAAAAASTVILVRKAAWKRPRSTVITGLAQAPSYVRQGYAVDWDATDEANSASLARARANLTQAEGK